MASVLEIRIDPSGAESGARRVNTALGGISKNAQEMGTSTSSAVRVVNASLVQLAATFAAFQASQAAFQAAQRAISINANLESNKLAIASLLQGTTQLVDSMGNVATSTAAWNVNLREAQNIQKQIAAISAQTLGTDEELLDVFRTALSFTRGQKADLQEVLKLSQGITNTGKLQGLAQGLLTTETRQLLQLESDRGQTLLQLLGLSLRQAQSYKEQGTLVQELNKRFEAYNALAKEAETSWEGLTTSVETFSRLFTAEAFSGTFAAIKQVAIGLTEELNKLQAQGGIVAAIGASDEQLQDLGRALADGFAIVQVSVASLANAVITAVAVFADGADAAENFHDVLADLAQFITHDLQIAIADTVRSVKELLELFSSPAALGALGALAGGLTGGIPGAAIGVAAGSTAGAFLGQSEGLQSLIKGLDEYQTKLREATETNQKFNAEIIDGFGALAKAEEAGFRSPGPVLDAFTKLLEEAAKGGAVLSNESERIVEAFGDSAAAAGKATPQFEAFKKAAESLGVKFNDVAGTFRRIPGAVNEVSEAMQTALDKIEKSLSKTAGASKEFLADATRNIDLFRQAQQDSRDQAANQIRKEAGGSSTDLEVAIFKLNTDQQVKDAREAVQKLIGYEKERTQEAITQAQLRNAANRAVAEAEVSRIQTAIGLNEQEQQSLSLLVGKEEERRQKGQELLVLQQQLGPAQSAVLRSQLAETQQLIAIEEKRAENLRKQRDEALRSAERAPVGAEQDTFRGISATFQNELNDSLNKVQDYQTKIQKIESDLAANHGASIEARMAGENELKALQVELTQQYLEEEGKRTRFAQEQIQARADLELQGVQQRISAIQNQQGLEQANLELRRAQGASVGELIDREKRLIDLEQQLAQAAVDGARVKLVGLKAQLEDQHKLVAVLQEQLRIQSEKGDFGGARETAGHLRDAAQGAVDFASKVAGAELALNDMNAAAVRVGVEGKAGVAQLTNELARMRSVFDESDLRGLFGDLLDADSLKEAGKALERESKNISKRTFEALLFGKRDNFDAPLIENVNGLFGVGDGGILGHTMQAGGKVQGEGWGKAVTGSAGQTITSQFPQIASQSLAATEGIFAAGGEKAGATFGENCLSGFENIFGEGIGGIIDGVMRLFSSSGGSSGGSGGGLDFGGLFDMFSGLFGSAGSTSATSFNSGFLGNFGQGFGDLGSSVDANSVDWTAAGSSGGSAFGSGFLSGFQGLFGGSGGGAGGGASGGGMAGGFMSWLGLGQVGASIGSDFSKGRYGSGAGGVVGGALGAYFSGGDPQITAAAAQLGQMIGGIFDKIFNEQGRIDKEKGKIIKYFEKVFDIDFKQITEGKAAAGLRDFADTSPAALALGAIFSEGLKKADIQGSTVRFAGQLLGNLRKMGDGADEVKEKLIELADAMNFDLKDSISQINAFTRETGADALTLNNFQEEIKEARKNLKEYGDTANLTAAQLTDLAAANGNTGSQLVTYVDLIAGAIDIGTEFNEMIDSQALAQQLAAERFLEAAEAAGSTGETVTELAEKIRTGNLSLEEAAIALNDMREAAGLAKLALKDLTIDPKQIELIVTILQSATEGLRNFQAGLTDLLASGLEQGLNPAEAGQRFDDFFNATLKVAIIKAMVGGLLEGLKIEALKPFFTAFGAEFTNLVSGAIDADEFGKRISKIRDDMQPAIDAARAGFVEVNSVIHDILVSMGVWTDAVDDTKDSVDELKDKLKAIDDQLLEIARRRIHIDIDLAANLADIGAITVAASLKIEAEGLKKEFDLITEKLNAMGNSAEVSVELLGEAISLVQQLAANVVAQFQAAKAAIEADLADEIETIKARGKAAEDAIRASFDAQRKALEARIDGLEKEKDLIEEAYDARREALEQELQVAQEFQRVGEELRDTIIRLQGSQAAPVTPAGQLSFLERQAAALRTQLAGADEEDRPELIRRLADILQQQLSLDVFQRPSDQYRDQFNAIVSELERLRDESLTAGSRAEEIQEELKQLDIERNAKLDAIDAQIDAARAQLDALSEAEQAALAAAAASIEAEIAAAQAQADLKIDELREAAKAELERLAEVERELLGRQEQVLLTEKDVLLAQLTELQKIADNTSRITTGDLTGRREPDPPGGPGRPDIGPDDFHRIPPPDPPGRGGRGAATAFMDQLDALQWENRLGAQWFTAPAVGPAPARITPTHTGGGQGGTTTVTIAPHVEVKVTITGVEKPDEIVRKVEGVVKKATVLAVEEWTNSSRGQKKIDDIATRAARKVSGV